MAMRTPAPAASKIAKQFVKLTRAHLKEAAGKNEDVTNLGHYVDDNTIGSKTTGGYLTSSIGKDGTISHDWDQGN